MKQILTNWLNNERLLVTKWIGRLLGIAAGLLVARFPALQGVADPAVVAATALVFEVISDLAARLQVTPMWKVIEGVYNRVRPE